MASGMINRPLVSYSFEIVDGVTIPNNWEMSVEGDRAAAGLGDISCSLSLGSEFGVGYYISRASSSTPLSEYTFSATNVDTGDEIEYTEPTIDSRGRIKLVTKVNAQSILDHFLLTVTYNGNTFKMYYSPMTYAYNRQNTSHLGHLMKSVYIYGYWAKEYFN